MAKLNVTPNPKIQHISRLDFFMKFYLMDFIMYVVIPETNKCINSTINFSEYFRVIGCRLIMGCYFGHFVRDFFLKHPITPQKGATIYINHIISGRHLDKFTQVMSFPNLAIPDFNDPFFQKRQMQKGWNNNMAAHFDPSWVSFLGESIQ